MNDPIIHLLDKKDFEINSLREQLEQARVLIGVARQLAYDCGANVTHRSIYREIEEREKDLKQQEVGDE